MGRISIGIDDCYGDFEKFFDQSVRSAWRKGYEKFQLIKDKIKTWKDLDILRHKFIRDPLWGEIRLNELEYTLLDSFFLQRLRHIVQMGGTRFVYPAANHKRFDHSLGTFGIISYILDEKILKRRDQFYAGKIKAVYHNYLNLFGAEKLHSILGINEVQELKQKTDDQLIENSKFQEIFRNWITQNLRISMLLHDIGHYAFSHTFELFLGRKQNLVLNYRPSWKTKFPKNPHEIRTREIILGEDPIVKELVGTDIINVIKELITNLNLDLEIIAESITGFTDFTLSGLVNGPLDADKMDYLARDNYFSMSPNQLQIFDRIYRLAKIDRVERIGYCIVFPERAISAIMKIIIARTFEYHDIINHPIQLCFQGLFIACLEKTLNKYENAVQTQIIKRLELMDDEQLLTALTILAGENTLAQNLLYAIRYRELYRKVGIYAKSTLPRLIEFLVTLEIDSFFIDSSKIINYFNERPASERFQKQVNCFSAVMDQEGFGIIVFFNQRNKDYSKMFEKINIELENSKETITLKDYMDNLYVAQFPELSNYQEQGKTIVSLLDIFNILDDSLYVYGHQNIINSCTAFLNYLFEEGSLEQFLIDCSEK